MGLLDQLVDETQNGWERDRAAQIDAVRHKLQHPPKHLEADENGVMQFVKNPLLIAENVEDVLRLDPWFRSRLRFNSFAGVVEWRGKLLKDEHVTGIRMAMSRTYKLRASLALTHEIVIFTARKLAYHPIKEWLTGLRWDGVKRIDKLLTNYAGCEDSGLHDTLSRRFMVSCVARVMDPGCKVDTVLILAGPQGYGKSTFFRALAGPDYFRDSAIDLRNKDAYMALRGAWIYEMAELAAMRPRDAETVKAFLSAQIDHFRPPYGRNQVEQPRQVVFVGTTNEPSFLGDPTGARRFWPAEVRSMPKVVEVERDRDQLWAEAVEAFNDNERWWLEVNEDDALTEAHEQYRHEDPWAPKVERWLDLPTSPKGFTIEEVLNAAIEKDGDKQNKADEMRIGGVLTAMGYERRRVQFDGRRVYRWHKRTRVLNPDE
jgi:predicted P-loop ATPase